MLRRNLLAGMAATGAYRARASPADQVDVLLVLAIDASGSLSDERLTMQREGHARAVESAAFLATVRDGHLGRVALAVVEWSSQDRQDLTVPWTVVQDLATAHDVANTLRGSRRPIPGFTSISGALDYSLRLLDRAPYGAARRLIDVSGNGPNNDGRAVEEARNRAIAAGVTINGVPILDAVHDLDAYFMRHVIGGPRAFMVVARDIDSFADSIRRKLISEIS